ncbi:ubiquitin-specific protease ubp15 [Kickxella alabastrina]|uniref:Ubiquitin-specific protease ubp15 n=1 Tax=Kickxella alabastrina TaxID=61397 RepID=A0ACC1ITC9_9FUNG|nr:ubiquitin-specific protease ubp15 [Kickxella alabastrina]
MDHNSDGENDTLTYTASEVVSLRDNSQTPQHQPSPLPSANDDDATIIVSNSTSANRYYSGLSTINEEEFLEANVKLEPKLEEHCHGYFHWEIEDWSQLPDRAISQTFTVGGRDWSILLFPRGNQAPETVSLYIERKASHGEADDWYTCATFGLAMSNMDDPSMFKKSVTSHRFTAEESDWGFTRFAELRHMITPSDDSSPALLDKGRVRISAYVRIVKDPLGVLWHNFHNYNSRKYTGHVGLRNQGATCYMNSLLQSLYFTNEFRNAVYQIPTEDEDPKKSVALALQRVFYNLQVSSEPVDTTELTKSFGWDSLESFMQHDVQEFNRVLQDSLETKMKGTVVDGAVANLFEGKMKSYIRCVNVNYESSRVENYYDISLNVKGCSTLRDSFANYCEVEMLDGENKYQAEGHGLQDARKGVIFESFPPVLQLQLKRFEYDFMRDAMVKINDRHEFPPSIDLGEFLSEDADRSKSWNYVLHGVLVHSGDLHGGHYFGLLRPTTENKWFRFDDDRVVPVSGDEVFEEYYGGEFTKETHQPQQLGTRARPISKRFTNAYMLVYIRESERDRVLSTDEAPVPEHLLRRIQQEKDELARRQREKQEMANTVAVKVVSNFEFRGHQGFDLCQFGPRQPSSNPLFSERMPRTMTLGEFKEHYANAIGRDPEEFRLWSMVGRLNKTIRCDAPLLDDSMPQTLAQIKETRSLKWPEVRFYCELRDTQAMPDGFMATPVPKGLSLIHLKFYDPDMGMVGIGSMYVHSGQLIRDIKPSLLSMAKLPADTQIILYEEVKPSLIERMDVSLSFSKAEIQTGDIICYQVAPAPGTQKYLATVPEYFDDIQHRVCVRFVPRLASKDQDDYNGSDSDSQAADDMPILKASNKLPYDNVAQWLAGQIGAEDPLKLRFYTVSPTGQPRQPVRRIMSTVLSDMLPNSMYTQPALNSDGLPEYTVMYERLEYSLAQMENMRSVRVTCIGKSMRDESHVEFLVPKTGVSQIIIDNTYAKLEQQQRSGETDPAAAADAAAPKPSPMRFYTASYHRFSHLLTGAERISEMGNPSVTEVIAERLSSTNGTSIANGSPASQRADSDLLMDIDVISKQGDGVDIEVFHFYRELNNTHSVPFLFRVYPGEIWADTWARLGRKLGLGEKELKNLGVVYGSAGTVELQRCHVIQGFGEEPVDSSPSMAMVVVNNNGTGQNSPMGSPQRIDAEAEPLHPAAGAAAAAVSMLGSDDMSLWDLIQQTTAAGTATAEADDVPMRNSSGTATGFIGLNHVDRVSRQRGAHHERAIRINN